jgi:hypothetical protein
MANHGSLIFLRMMNLNKEPRRTVGFFVQEEKVPRIFLILNRGSATPPSLTVELNRPKAPPHKRALGY